VKQCLLAARLALVYLPIAPHAQCKGGRCRAPPSRAAPPGAAVGQGAGGLSPPVPPPSAPFAKKVGHKTQDAKPTLLLAPKPAVLQLTSRGCKPGGPGAACGQWTACGWGLRARARSAARSSELRVITYELRATSCELRATSCRVIGHCAGPWAIVIVAVALLVASSTTGRQLLLAARNCFMYNESLELIAPQHTAVKTP
jgi:hypothetical protein